MHDSVIITNHLKKLHANARAMVHLGDVQIMSVLNVLADLAERDTKKILEANQKDLDRMDPSNPKYDRLLLNQERIVGIANDLRNVARLPSPLNKAIEEKKLENGLTLKKVSVPIGIIGIVYESRPNVTFDVFSLCFKSGNACVLKGSSDAKFSNEYIVSLILKVLEKHEIPPVVFLAPSERSALKPILDADDYIDTIIPRGGQGLINYVREHARVPVIETGAGIVHTYLDLSADLEKAKSIIKNAKTRRVSVCNALDTLLVHEGLLGSLPSLIEGLDQNFKLEIFADEKAYDVLYSNYDPELLHQAGEDHFGTEFLAMKMAIKVVDSISEALDHIYKYSSKHSEAIIAEDPNAITRFYNDVDAAVVYSNTSTAFTDGAQFGLGAEIGISTQKLHARGPMALNELTSYKWLVEGSGQIRD